jgi:hypothetical protein
VSDTLSLNSTIPSGHPVRAAYFELLGEDDTDATVILLVNTVIVELSIIPSSYNPSYIKILSQLLSTADGRLRTRVVEEVRAIIGRVGNNPNISEMQAIIGDTPSRVGAAAPGTTVTPKLGLYDVVPGTDHEVSFYTSPPPYDEDIDRLVGLLDNDKLNDEARREVIKYLRYKVPTLPISTDFTQEGKDKARAYIAGLATPGSVGIPTAGEVDPSKGDPSKLTTKQPAPAITYPPAADWGMRVTQVDTNKSYFFSLLPAMDSVIPMTASKDVPNALPGLHIRVKANIAKLRVPGSTPIYQHMGIDSVIVTVVGMFTGVDGDKPSPATYLSHATGKDKVGTLMAKLDTYGAMQSFYEHAYLSGADLDVEINMARYQAFDVEEGVIRSAKTGNPRFRGHLSLLEVAHARSDRTYYTLQFETRSLTEDKCEITKIEHIPASLKEAIKQATVEEQNNARNAALAIAEDINMAEQGKDGKTISKWESGDRDPTGHRLSVNKVCDKDGTCRYYVLYLGQLSEVTDRKEIDKLENEKQ